MKKNSVFIGVTLAALLTLSGCATFSTPRTFNELGQFSTYQLNQSTFRVGLRSNSNMSYGVAQEIALVKAAQITVQNGFQYFKVLNDPSQQNHPPRQAVVYPMSTGPMFRPYGFYGPRYGYWGGPWNDFPQVITVEPNEVAYNIECFKSSQNYPKDAFDAMLILKSLGLKYGVTENGTLSAPHPIKTT